MKTTEKNGSVDQLVARQKKISPTAQILETERRSEPPKKWAAQAQLLEDLRAQLLEERGGQLAEAAQPLEAHSMHLADSGTDEFDHEVALANVSSRQDQLLEIEAALQRIRNGTYGICEETGQSIPAERLATVPWTRFTVEAEARLEGKGLVGWSPHLGQLGSVRPPPGKPRPSKPE